MRRARRRWLAAGTAVAVVGVGVAAPWWWTGRPDVAGGDTGNLAGACFAQRHDVIDLDGGWLHNSTPWTAHLTAVEPRKAQGLTVREVRVLPPDQQGPDGYTIGGAHDPEAAFWSDTEVLGPEGYDLEPGETVMIALVADVDASGAQFSGTTVHYDVGPFPHQGWYPMYTRVLGSHETECTDEMYDEMVAADGR